MSDFKLGLIKTEDNSNSSSLQEFQRFIMVPRSSCSDFEVIELLDSPCLKLKFAIDTGNCKLRIQFESDSSNVHKYEVELYQCFHKGSKCKLLLSTSLTYNQFSNYEFVYCIPIKKYEYEKLEDSPYHLLSIQIKCKDSFALEKNLAPDPKTDCSLLFENNDLTNFVINVDDLQFPVHKEILAAKSSVFLAMFKNNVKESEENQMTIEDFNADVIREFIRYIYTYNVENLDLHCKDLLIVAEKYDVPKLKSICGDKLLKSVTVDNALSTLQFADTYNAHDLKEQIDKFVKHNIKSIIKTDEFKTFPPTVSMLADIINDLD